MKNFEEEVVVIQAGEGPDEPESGALAPCLKELVRYYRHSAVGRRVSGFIHNLNSPLQVISFQLELLEQKSQEEAAALAGGGATLPQLAAWHEYRVQKIRALNEEVQNIRDMLHHLTLQSIHEGEEEQCYLDLNQILREELELYRADPFFKHRVEKNISLAAALPPVYGHYVDFSQSFRHLVDNALEAMAESPRRLLTVATLVEQDLRIIRIGDTGVGISPKMAPRLFKPFFTTKDAKGAPRAGLGLFMTRRLLAPYEGGITIESRPGQTWVTVRLPIIKRT
jgi:signal transduction histidine kinase|uniref:histidine kinase n=1 Tax=Desulfobacca acetoxidans TaxID=60893 RepID=A0A7C3V3G9_9BACT